MDGPARKGTHRVLERLAVIVVDDDVKRFSRGLLAAMRRQSELSREEFVALLKTGKKGGR
jgi:hypothetical protein